jgi:protein SCO1/2
VSSPKRNPTPYLAAVLVALVVAIAIVVVAGGGGDHAQPTASGTAPNARLYRAASTIPSALAQRRVPAFELTDARGGRLASRTLAGRPFVLTFLYVHCPDVCPLIGSEIQQALAKLGAEGRGLNVVAVSVDPSGDTRAAVEQWLAAHREPSNFHYLIGTRRQLAPVWKSFFVSPQTPTDRGSTHTAVIWLVNRRGHPTALIPAGTPVRPADLAYDFRTLLSS